jgi:hypothetical protein
VAISLAIAAMAQSFFNAYRITELNSEISAHSSQKLIYWSMYHTYMKPTFIT